MLISNGAYKLALIMEDERINLGGELVFLFSNKYQIDDVFQDKVQSFSKPIEISGLVEYADGYDKTEEESGYETNVSATITISKKKLNELKERLKEGDYIKIENRLKEDHLDDEENFDDYDSFVIKTIRPITVEGQYLNRIISYECELTDSSSRNFDDEL